MGTYFNPGNNGFRDILNGKYVDKTGMLRLLNRTMNSPAMLTCVSRPRRFGKSFAAKMLCAYYDCSCDSEKLFAGLEISRDGEYRNYLDQFHVLCLDITGFISAARRESRSLADVPNDIVKALRNECAELYPELSGELPLTACLRKIVEKTQRKFVFVIDEWDALIREAKDDSKTQALFLDLLREWFKNINFTSDVVACAYMTGILPIKKDGSESAISDFQEYTMLKPRKFAEYVGFTESEVRILCMENHVDFERMKHWYDGYGFREIDSVYNPNSVMKAIDNEDFDSYWTETSAAEGLLHYISQDFNGMARKIAELLAGIPVKVSTTGFANDLTTFRGRDDVLTLMIHLGYLAYDEKEQTTYIPNKEIQLAFAKAEHLMQHPFS